MGKRRLTFKEKATYALGDLAGNLTWQLVKLLLIYFYTDIYGISPKEAGLIYLVSRIWDAVNDPIMGYIADHTHTRWGRFRPYMLFGAIPLAISTILTFSTPVLDESWKFAYALVTFLMLSTLYTLVTLPYSTLAAVITDDADERSSIAGFRMIFAILGLSVVSVATGPLVRLFEDEATGYQVVVTGYSILATVLFWISFGSVKEQILPTQKESYTIKQVPSLIFKNRPLLLLAGAVFFTGMAGAMKMGAGMYFCKYFLRDQGLFSYFMLAVITGAAVGVVMSTNLTRRFSKKSLFLFGITIECVADMGLFGFSSTSIKALPEIFSMLFISSIGGGIGIQLMWAMAPDLVDYGEWKTGKRADGMTYAALSFVQKLDTGIGGAMIGFILGYAGYIEPLDGILQEQTKGTLLGILFMVSLAPVIAGIIALSFVAFYDTSREQAKTQKVEALT